MKKNLKERVNQLMADIPAVFIAMKDGDTPFSAKLLAGLTVGYALSPIDLIPDFIPVLGYVDDMVLLPALIWLTVKLLPPEVLAECRGQADAWMQANGAKPRSRFGMVLIVLVWLGVGTAAWWWLKSRL